MNRKRIFLLSSLFVIYTIAIQAQLLSPQDFLPHNYGKSFTPHHLLVDYYKHVAEQLPNVEVYEYGHTYQNRPLIYAVLTHADNVRDLEKIRENNLIRANRIDGPVNSEFDKAIVWLSFGVHGNEAAASESSMEALYALATGSLGADLDWLKNTVVVLDPCLNPDGYNRYTNWYINVAGNYVNPHSSDQQHLEPWPSGRVNHYLHDLNRDWAWATQIESQQRLKVYHQWLPHIHADFHEMSPESPYFFAPAAEPFHSNITEWQRSFQIEIGKNHARQFDKRQWLYYTKEDFDLFYPSYGDTYATFNGAIGMTYEQGGSGRAGRAILLTNGDTLTLKDRIDHHVIAAISTVEVASKNTSSILVEFEKYFDQAISNPPGDYRSYIIKTDQSENVASLLQLLDLHHIEHGVLNADQSIHGYDFNSFEEDDYNGKKGDIVVPVRQPYAHLIQVLFEPDPVLLDSLTYDITSWSLLSAYGLEAIATKDEVSYTKPENQPSGLRVAQPNALCYVLSATDEKFTSAVAKVMKDGRNCRVSKKPFVNSGQSFPAGSVLVTQADNKNIDLQAYFNGFIQTSQAHIVPLQSGFSEQGPDIGSQYMVLMNRPKVVLVSGERVRANNYGQVWYYLDQVLGIPYTAIDHSSLKSLNLDDFNTLILAEGHYTELDDQLLSELMKWVNRGGKIIAFGGALSELIDENGFDLRIESAHQEAEDNSEEVVDRYEHILHEQASDWMPGAIVRLSIDDSHPLGTGLGSYYSSLKTSTTTMYPSKKMWNVGYIGEDLYSTGFIGNAIKPGLVNTSSFFVSDEGKGHLIGFIDNPLYRSFWLGGRRLFFNALYLVD